jgi:3-oxoacyl-[acyl-carrier protein] reductase
VIVWITGGGTGIGRALAQRFLNSGAKVVIMGRRPDVLNATAQDLAAQANPANILAIPGSATDPTHVNDVIDQTQRRWGAVDVLVNNAGSNPVHSIFETPFEEYQTSFENNCLSTILCTQAVLPEMMKVNRGAIINISSIYGRWGAATSASYSVSKFALTGYTEALRQALVDTPIQVMAVYPGFIRTDMTLPYVAQGSLRSHLGKSPDQLAKVIIDALRRKKTDVYYPWYVPVVLRARRWFPKVADRLAKRVKR